MYIHKICRRTGITREVIVYFTDLSELHSVMATESVNLRIQFITSSTAQSKWYITGALFNGLTFVAVTWINVGSSTSRDEHALCEKSL